jgi:5-methylcytosine-specific restriction endonuclease McrA
MLSSPVLVLNKNYMPVNIVTVKRAFCMFAAGIAKAVDKEFRTFDFMSWAALSASVHDDTVGLVGRTILVPRVLILASYERLPKRRVRFSRMNILLRDGYTCQYCGSQMRRWQLNIDHVLPRSRGGLTTWENVVASCVKCNLSKGGRTPEEAGMRLLKKPARPQSTPYAGLSNLAKYEEWKPFVSMIDFSYWNVELES